MFTVLYNHKPYFSVLYNRKLYLYVFDSCYNELVMSFLVYWPNQIMTMFLIFEILNEDENYEAYK